MNKALPIKLGFYAYCSLIAAVSGTAAGALWEPGQGIISMPDSAKMAQAQRSEPLPLPRNPDVAVQEEFDAARAGGTIKAWELFLARHSDHRLAADAAKELKQLKQSPAR